MMVNDRYGSRRATALTRRALMLGAGAASVAGRGALAQAPAAAPQPDHTLRIAPVSLEIAPGKTIKTTGYNGSVPGPLLRLREGKPVTINVINDAGYPDIVHWHGLYLPAVQDGATEEGSPIIPAANRIPIRSRPSRPARAGITATPWRCGI